MGRVFRLPKWATRAARRTGKSQWRVVYGAERNRTIEDRRLICEELELRTMLSSGPIALPLSHSSYSSAKDTSPLALTPNQVRDAYGLGSYTDGVLSDGIKFGSVQADGAGQTIAIVDAYDYPTALNDVNAFSTYFGLPTFNSTGGPTFQVLTQKGKTVSENRSSPNYVATDPAGSPGTQSDDWEGEESLDIDWAHAIAPMANIDLFEANDDTNNLANLFTAVQTAADTPGVVAVSMSWDDDDGFANPADGTNYLTAAQEANYDSKVFTTPTGHIGGAATLGGKGLTGGVTFLAAAGDNGAYDFYGDSNVVEPEYPTDSPNVVSVGGTYLTVNGSNPDYTYGTETAWGDGTDSGSDGGGGGGVATYAAQPSYQASVVNSNYSSNEGTYSSPHRTFPDISLQAAPDGTFTPNDPGIGLPVYDSYDNGAASPWSNGVGGTSESTPMFAGMIALADQGRAISGQGSLDSRSQTLPLLYSLPSTDFHDITIGSTGPSPEFDAGAGYDLASGLGSPVGNELIPGLVDYAPTFTSISPATGPANGGTPVTITGTNFTGASVFFGATPATNVDIVSSTEITATSPVGFGTVDVTVVGPGGTTATSSADQFTYVGTPSAPTVTGVSPNEGALNGGTTVTISGSNLGALTAVDFGTTPADLSTLVYNANGSISISNPAGSLGTVDITVVGPGGTSTVSTSDQFTFISAPVVSGISPTIGPVGGGTQVVITGSNLANITAVDFGGTPAALSSVIYNSNGTVTVTSPAESAGTVDVTVSTFGGTSATVAGDEFTFSNTIGSPPTVTGISPSSGPTAGGTLVTITGTNLEAITAIDFGSTVVNLYNYSSNQSISVVSPAGSAGSVDLVVSTVSGTSTVSTSDRFTFLAPQPAPTVTAVTPATGPLAGGTAVTITGAHLTGITAIDFGGVAAALSTLVYNSNGSITVTSPAESAGIANITVTTAGGVSAISTADQFTYSAIALPVTVVSVSSTTAKGTYKAGTVIPIAVTFSGNVTVTGKPQVGLDISGAEATYASGSGTATLIFNYTVLAGQYTADLDYASTSALTLNGGTIQYATGKAAVLTLPATGSDGLATRGIAVGTAPLVSVSKAASATPTPVTGKTVTLSVLGSDSNYAASTLTYTWAATSLPSGASSPAFSVNGSNAATTTVATFSQAGTYRFTATIADPSGLSTTSSVSVTVNQTLTSIVVSSTATTVSSSAPQQFTAVAEDQFGASMATQPAFTWTTTVGTISSGGLLTVSSSAPTTGTVTAAAGSIHGSAAFNVGGTAFSATLFADTLLPGQTSLFVTGATTNDVIYVTAVTGTSGMVNVQINGTVLGPFVVTGRIVIDGASAAGYTDYINVSSKITLPTWIYGDAGKDTLVGGGGSNIIIGGSGASVLYGGAGRNILIAGTGADSLVGGTGDGLLIGGTTAFNANSIALLSIMNEWNSADSYAVRESYIAGKAGGLNGSYYLNANTITSSAVDTLLGGSANDVFFQLPSDKVLNRRATEVLLTIY